MKRQQKTSSAPVPPTSPQDLPLAPVSVYPTPTYPLRLRVSRLPAVVATLVLLPLSSG